MEERIKALSESMLSNLQRAFENMTDNERGKFPEGQDAEREMLALLAKVKNLKDKIDGISMDDTPDDLNSEAKK